MAKSIEKKHKKQVENEDNPAVAMQKALLQIQSYEIPSFEFKIPKMQIPIEGVNIPKMAEIPIFNPAPPGNYTKSTPKRNSPYAGQYFKLLEFKIVTRYKNLENLHIDFRNTTSYCTFIGLNGSGKSNVIEAISAVFYSLYRLASLKTPPKTAHCPFEYQLSYVHNEHLVEIENGKTKDGKKVTESILPKNVIVNYSGEETRLWRQYYEPIYSKFCGKLTDESQRFDAPQMLYIDKSCWEIALLILLYSESEGTTTFVKSLLGNVRNISFEYNNGAFKHWEQNFTKIFIDELKKEAVYTIEEFRELVQSIDFIDSERTLFLLLYQATKHDDDCLISKINIEFENGANAEGLSEGEKKLILSYAILHVLATETSLTMFDEPDSHVHIARKTELVELLNTENRYSIVTTHSPVFIEKMRDTNIRFLKNGHLEDVEKLKHIAELSGGEVNYLDGAFILSSKYVVVVEGNSDINYIRQAIGIFSIRDNKYNCLKKLSYLPLGSADHTESFYKNVIVNTLESVDRILFIYDHDKNGKNGHKIVDNYKAKQPKINAIYYQPNYSDNIEDKDSFFIEDLFDSASYQEILDELKSISQYNVFKGRKKSTCEMIKDHISAHYADDSFKKHYEGFKPLLDYLVEYFFPQSQQPKAE